MSERELARERHPIGVVARRTGVPVETLRAWERRYDAVRPGRTAGGQRLYSDEDVERLQLLRSLTEEGWSIGRVAALPLVALRELVREGEADGAAADAAAGGADGSAEAELAVGFLEEGLAAVEGLDAAALEGVLRRALVVHGVRGYATGVVLPMLRHLGDAWEASGTGVAQEHLASAVIRRLLGEVIAESRVPAAAPALVAATLPNQMHEFGVLLAGVMATAAAWRVIYLGANVPPEEIALAVRRTGALVVVLGITEPVDDALLPGELRRLQAGLITGVEVIAGGPAASGLSGLLESEGCRVLRELPDMVGVLASIAKGRSPG
jgi:MerR family transcriptional regulator, light-induced transcriptional regulator